jgi:hypothetical protein
MGQTFKRKNLEFKLVLTVMGKVTHVVMTGGTLEITDTMGFYGRYIQRVVLGEKQHIVEMKTDRFKFYIDFDLKDAEQMQDERAIQIFKEWESVIEGPVYAAKAPCRIVDGQWKSGFHLIWPDRVVSKQGYTKLRNSAVMKTPDLADFIDTPSSGLRMLWSHKHPVGKPYVPFVSIFKGQVKHLDPSPNVNMLSKFSIRADSLLPVTSDDKQSDTALEMFIRKHVKGQDACNIKRILANKQGTVIQTDSTYCENLGGRHKSNHIWFLVKNGILYQKCHCQCDVKRLKGVTCNKFVGTGHVIPPSILESLDPESDAETEDGPVNILSMF